MKKYLLRAEIEGGECFESDNLEYITLKYQYFSKKGIPVAMYNRIKISVDL